MEHSNTTLSVDDVVVFTPDDKTIRQYSRAFGRLRIYPGYVAPIVRITAGLIRVEGTLKAWPASQFRPAASFGPGEIAAYQARVERDLYALQDALPFTIGDKVRFRPSDRCDLIHGAAFRAAGLYPSYVGTITTIGPDETIEIDRCGQFYHWSEFER